MAGHAVARRRQDSTVGTQGPTSAEASIASMARRQGAIEGGNGGAHLGATDAVMMRRRSELRAGDAEEAEVQDDGQVRLPPRGWL
jgi:hypothetical protein